MPCDAASDVMLTVNGVTYNVLSRRRERHVRSEGGACDVGGSGRASARTIHLPARLHYALLLLRGVRRGVS
jgi:hypothetical protein